MRKLLLAAALIGSVSACGDDNDTPPNVTVSCNFATEALCDLIVGTQAGLDAAGFTTAACTENGGTFGSSCSSVNRVGRCMYTSTGMTGIASFEESYYSPTWDVTTAQTNCLTPPAGTFTPN
jgi:hypothetical protein